MKANQCADFLANVSYLKAAVSESRSYAIDGWLKTCFERWLPIATTAQVSPGA